MSREGRSDTQRRNISARDMILNTLSSYAVNLVDVVVLLAILPFILTSLGAEQFGLWSLVWAIISLLSLVDMGFGTSVVKYVADGRGRNDHERVRQVVCTLFWVFVGQAFVLLALVGFSWFFFTKLFEIPAQSQAIGSTVLLVVGGGFAIGVPLNMFRGVLIGHQKQWIANAYKIAGMLVYCIAVLTVLGTWPDLRTLALLNLVLTIATPLALAIHAKLSMPSLSLHPRHFERKLLREVWSFSFFFMLINVAAFVAMRVDIFVIKSALPLTAIAIYALAMRIATQVHGVSVQVSRTLTPVVAELHVAGEESQLRRVWLTGTKMAVAVAAPLVVGCAVLARPLILNWVGSEFAGAIVILQVLLGAVMHSVIQSNSLNLLAMRGEQKLVSYTLVASQILNLSLSILLVHVWGLLGVAIATLISELPFQLGVIQGRLKRRYTVSRWSYYRDSVLPSAWPVLAMSGAFWLWQQVHPISSLLEVALVEVIGVGLFWLLFWFSGFSLEERTYIREKIAQWLTRRAAD